MDLNDFIKRYKRDLITLHFDESSSILIEYLESQIPIIVKREKVYSEFYKGIFEYAIVAEIDVSLCRNNLTSYEIEMVNQLIYDIEKHPEIFSSFFDKK